MSIVWIGDGLWIDTVVGSITTAASIGYHIATIPIERDGIFLGGTMTTRSGQDENLVTPALQPSVGGAIDIGDEVSNTLRIGINQIDATARTTTFICCIFLKSKRA